MIESSAYPTTIDDIPELERKWPSEDPWAVMALVHGLGEHSGRYERTGALMATAGIDVTAFDLVGFGATGGRRSDIDRWSRYLDQTQSRIEALRTTALPVVLLGHSMGGLIALEYALTDRPQPDALVLSAPGLGGGKAWQRKLAPLLAKVAPTLAVPTAITGDQLSRDPAVGEAYFSDAMVSTKASARLGAELFAAGDRVMSSLGALSVPTLVIHGGADTLVPPQSSLPLAALPGVERRLYPSLRHELFNEPEGPDVVSEVVDWIRAKVASSR